MRDPALAARCRAILDEASRAPIHPLPAEFRDPDLLRRPRLRPILAELLRRKRVGEPYAAEAAALVEQREGRLCIRLYRRPDGTMITRDCPVGVRAVRAKMALTAGRVAAAVAFLVGGGFVLGSSREPSPTRVRQLEPFATLAKWLAPGVQPLPPAGAQMIMGDICITPQPPVKTPTTGGR